jgi:hypothetical protein
MNTRRHRQAGHGTSSFGESVDGQTQQLQVSTSLHELLDGAAQRVTVFL